MAPSSSREGWPSLFKGLSFCKEEKRASPERTAPSWDFRMQFKEADCGVAND
jgi:hypothetical protein